MMFQRKCCVLLKCQASCDLYSITTQKTIQSILKLMQQFLPFLGICAGSLKIDDVQSGRPTIEEPDCGDRFKLIIPYAGQSITWEVVFNSVLLHFPPDFCFDDDTFLSDPEVGIIEENVPSLANWDSQDSKSLLYVICELLALYRKHQVSVLYEVAF